MWLLSFLIGSVGRWLLIGAAAAAILAGAYVWGRMDCTAAANVRHLEAQVDMLTRTLERRERITRADNAQRELDQAALAELDTQNRELSDELQDRDGCGLSGDTVQKLRQFWAR